MLQACADGGAAADTPNPRVGGPANSATRGRRVAPARPRER
jgi:hypothetical protein